MRKRFLDGIIPYWDGKEANILKHVCFRHYSIDWLLGMKIIESVNLLTFFVYIKQRTNLIIYIRVSILAIREVNSTFTTTTFSHPWPFPITHLSLCLIQGMVAG